MEANRYPDKFTWLVENEYRVRALCIRLARGRSHLADDIYSAVVDMFADGRISVQEWNGSGTLNGWLLSTIRLRMFRWAQRRSQRAAKQSSVSRLLPDGASLRNLEIIDAGDEYAAITERMDPHDVSLLLARMSCGMSFQEIADTLGVSKATAITYVSKAAQHAREVADQMK